MSIRQSLGEQHRIGYVIGLFHCSFLPFSFFPLLRMNRFPFDNDRENSTRLKLAGQIDF